MVGCGRQFIESQKWVQQVTLKQSVGYLSAQVSDPVGQEVPAQEMGRIHQ